DRCKYQDEFENSPDAILSKHRVLPRTGASIVGFVRCNCLLNAGDSVNRTCRLRRGQLMLWRLDISLTRVAAQRRSSRFHSARFVNILNKYRSWKKGFM